MATETFLCCKKYFIKNLQNDFFVYKFAVATEKYSIYASVLHIFVTIFSDTKKTLQFII